MMNIERPKAGQMEAEMSLNIKETTLNFLMS